MSLYNKDLGTLGETIASQFLQKKRYQILDRNFHTHWGEIDIIAKLPKKISFIEVKTRTGSAKGAPYESVHFYKRRSLKRAIQYYLLQKDFKDYKLTMDIISIELDFNHRPIKIKHFENVDAI